MSLTIKCRCCGKNVKVDLQERYQYFDKSTTPPTKLPAPVAIAPSMHITCFNPDCQLYTVTFTVVEIVDYETRPIEDKLTINGK